VKFGHSDIISQLRERLTMQDEYDFRSFTFGTGSHKTRQEGMCVMEAVAYVAGESHSDHPKCACPVISAFLRSWNDSIPEDDRRRELLSPFVFRLPGTKATPEIELQRSWMAFDWLVRECAAEFLSLSPTLQQHAIILRGLPEINQSNFDMVVPLIKSARVAARAAAGDAAWAAAGDAAWAAARAAAGDAAWAAAGDAAGAAARAAAWAAARAAAWAAAGDAAGAAAGDALAPSVHRIQESAAQLVDRMIRLTEPQEIVSDATKAVCHT
jgi:hypothetical protein